MTQTAVTFIAENNHYLAMLLQNIHSFQYLHFLKLPFCFVRDSTVTVQNILFYTQSAAEQIPYKMT